MNNIQSLTEDQIIQLEKEGVTLEQIAQLAKDQGQEVPPLVKSMIDLQLSTPANGQITDEQVAEQVVEIPTQPAITKKSSKFPALMDITTYNQYKNVIKEEKKHKTQEHKPNVYGYTFSPLLSENIIQDMKRTQGSFFVGVNISNLFNTFRNMVVDSEKKNKT